MRCEHVVTGGGGVSGDDKSVGCGDEGEEVRESKYGAESCDAEGDIWEVGRVYIWMKNKQQKNRLCQVPDVLH